MLLIICVERLLHIGSHFSLRKWRRQPHFPIKLAAVAYFFPIKLEAAASFSYKIGGCGKDLATLLAAVLTWSGYWGWCMSGEPGAILFDNRHGHNMSGDMSQYTNIQTMYFPTILLTANSPHP